MRNQIIFAFAVLFAFTFIAKAQTQNVSNNEQPKVVAALAPVYPAVARAVGASGDIIIEVKINSQGKVTSANAISGHPLLRDVSSIASKRWKFENVEDNKSERKTQLTFSYKVARKKEGIGVYFNPPYRIEIISEEVPDSTGLPLKANKAKKQ
ncbi:MAG TPA: energy transducer TonB [Pyrinomonadaceae bacterium]